MEQRRWEQGRWQCRWISRMFFVMAAAACMIFSGCGRNELENNAFPLALGIETSQNGKYHMYAAYPDLQSKDSKDNVLANDLFWDGTVDHLLEGTVLMSEGSSHNVNLNHLKVFILDCKILDGEEQKEDLIEFFREKRDAAWNSYVLLTDGEMGNIFSGELEMNSCLGIYLEDLEEGWTQLKRGSLVTVGDLMSQFYNADEILFLPVVTVEEKRPVVNRFAVVKNLEYVSELSMEQVFDQYTGLKIFEGYASKS